MTLNNDDTKTNLFQAQNILIGAAPAEGAWARGPGAAGAGAGTGGGEGGEGE